MSNHHYWAWATWWGPGHMKGAEHHNRGPGRRGCSTQPGNHTQRRECEKKGYEHGTVERSMMNGDKLEDRLGWSCRCTLASVQRPRYGQSRIVSRCLKTRHMKEDALRTCALQVALRQAVPSPLQQCCHILRHHIHRRYHWLHHTCM